MAKRNSKKPPKQKQIPIPPVPPPALLQLPDPEQETMAVLPDTVKQALGKLKPQHAKFVIAYVGEASYSPERAAIAAGYSGTQVAAHGRWVLGQPLVRAAIEAWMTAYAMQAPELTQRIADLATANIKPFTRIAADGALEHHVTIENWQRYGHWVKSIECDPETGYVTKVTVHDAQKAQQTLAKILQLFSDAPLLIFQFQTRRASDDEILARLDQARKLAQGAAYLGVQKALPPAQGATDGDVVDAAIDEH